MPEITAKEIQRLRQDAGVGMMDAKQALTEAHGDFEKALDLLRAKGVASVAKRAERQATEGCIGSYLHRQADRPVIGVLVELACETDFVAKSDDFQEVAREIAKHISWAKPKWVRVEDVPEDALDESREETVRVAQSEGKPEQVIPRIVEGKLKQFIEKHVLYEQTFINEQIFEGTVGDMVNQMAARMGENVSVRRFSRLAVGES